MLQKVKPSASSTSIPFSQGATGNGWKGQLLLQYERNNQGQTTVSHRHTGPMRVFKSLYPQGPEICHTVLIHPPGGLVGGDVLSLDIELKQGSHAFIGTPGAARFYASDHLTSTQQVNIIMQAESRLEWCPLETLAYPGCQAHSRWSAHMHPSAEMIAWDISALGLPASKQRFDRGVYAQRFEVVNCWLEQGRIDASDTRLMQGKLGLAGYSAMGTLWFATGATMSAHRIESLVEGCRAALPTSQAELLCGVTSPNSQMVVVRALAHTTEPILHTFQNVWKQLRQRAWDLKPVAPRIWQV